MNSDPFLIEELSLVRAKIENLPARWDCRWRRFLDEARREERSIPWYAGDARDTPLHAAFAFLITGEAEFAEIARRDFLWMLDRHEETLAVGSQDHDTWIYAAALARRAASLDWMWDRGVLDADEQERLADFFITEALKYSVVVLQHRVPAHASNQGLAMALDCVITGWLFGIRRGNDGRAQHLLEFGLPHLLQQIALLPPGGYSGEGSTYIFMVADPLMALACATLEEISGEEWFDREFWPSRNSAGEVLDLGPKLVPPSGLLPAWDQHGYHLRKAGAACAYVAHRTADPAAYRHFMSGPGWEFSGRFAWMCDDHVWQWIWMPDPRDVQEQPPGVACYPASWAEPRVGGALLDTSEKLHLFQMWDVSCGRPVRLHMNPNSLLLEAWGSPLTVDGNATEEFPLDQDPRMQYLHQYSARPRTLSWAAGSLGAHSVIWIDGDVAHCATGGGYANLPAETPTGFLIERVDDGGFQLVSTDVAAFYRDAFDVRSMIRSSALVDDSFWVVLDRIVADSAHEFTWQLVLRAGAVATDYGARLVTAEHVVLDVVNLDPVAADLHDIAGYPSLLEKRCHHLRKTQRGAEVEFLTVLIPQLARRELGDWTFGWLGTWADPVAATPPAEAAWNPVALDSVCSGAQDVALWLRRTCEVPAALGTLLLELPRPHPIRLWIDGREVDVPPVDISKDGEARLVAAFIDVSEALLEKSEIDITLRIDPTRAMGTVGGVKLHLAVEVAAPTVECVGSGRLLVRGEGGDHVVDIARLRTVPRSPGDLLPEGEDPLATATALSRRLLADARADERIAWDGTVADRGRACVAAVDRPLAEVEGPLLRCCDDTDWLVRMLAIRALGNLRSRRAVPKLCAIMRGETPDLINASDYAAKYRIKEMCVIALGEIGDVSAAADLVHAMDHAGFYGVRRIVPGVLQKLGVSDAIATLERWESDADTETADACRRARRSLATAG